MEFGEIGADMVGIGRFLARRPVAVDLGRFEIQHRIARRQRRPRRGGERDHPAAGLGQQRMLHLHRLHHRELPAGKDQIALGHVDRHQSAVERRGDGHRARRGRLPTRRARLARVRQRGEMQRRRAGGDGKLGRVSIDEARVDPVGTEVAVRQHRLKERDIGLDARDAELAQRPRRFLDHFRPARRGRVDDHLGEQ